MKTSWRSMFAVAIIPMALAACGDDMIITPDFETSIRLQVVVEGTLPAPGFEIQVDGGRTTTVTESGASAHVVKSVSTGSHTVSVVNLPAGCTADPQQTTVNTIGGQVVDVPITVSC